MPLHFGAQTSCRPKISSRRAIGMCGEADQAARKFGQLLERRRAFALRRAQLHARDQAAEIAITLARCGEQGIRAPIRAGDFAPDMRAHARLLRRHMEARRAVHAIAIQQSHRRHVEAAQRRNFRNAPDDEHHSSTYARTYVAQKVLNADERTQMQCRRTISISVVTPLHEPTAGGELAVNAIQRSVRKRDVPFVALPGVDGPPIAACPPGTRAISTTRPRTPSAMTKLGCPVRKSHASRSGAAARKIRRNAPIKSRR